MPEPLYSREHLISVVTWALLFTAAALALYFVLS